MADKPIADDLLEILRCPEAVRYEDAGDDPGVLELVQVENGDWWLTSADSGYKYPIREGIPVLLIDEGKKWKDTAVAALPPIAEIFTD